MVLVKQDEFFSYGMKMVGDEDSVYIYVEGPIWDHYFSRGYWSPAIKPREEFFRYEIYYVHTRFLQYIIFGSTGECLFHCFFICGWREAKMIRNKNSPEKISQHLENYYKLK